MRLMRRENTPDEIRIRNHQAGVISDARAEGAASVTFPVGTICREPGIASGRGFAFCSAVIDSVRLARAHGIWHQQRLGTRGTDSAEYVFLIDMQDYRPVPRQRSTTYSRAVRALLIMSLLALSAAAVWALATFIYFKWGEL